MERATSSSVALAYPTSSTRRRNTSAISFCVALIAHLPGALGNSLRR